MRSKVTSVLIFVAGSFAVFLDQILKLGSVNKVTNTGFALGVNFGSSWLIQVLVILGLTAFILRTKDKFTRSALILIVIISFSNLYDRLTLGYVVDYWQITGIWVNLSDVLISALIAIMLLNYLAPTHGNKPGNSHRKRST